MLFHTLSSTQNLAVYIFISRNVEYAFLFSSLIATRDSLYLTMIAIPNGIPLSFSTFKVTLPEFSYRAVWINFPIFCFKSSFKVSFTMPRVSSLSRPSITSSFSCTIFWTWLAVSFQNSVFQLGSIRKLQTMVLLFCETYSTLP